MPHPQMGAARKAKGAGYRMLDQVTSFKCSSLIDSWPLRIASSAVLSAPRDAVESRVRESGSNATVRTVIPLLLTAVICSPS